LVLFVEYLSIASRETMEELTTVDATGAVVSVALRLGKVRLIDNIMLTPP
jgi:pantoate--beta-alanine ligase